jgi:hypothetical protein
MKPLYALHKDAGGNILGATSFDSNDDYGLRSWVGKLALRDGDTIAFGEIVERKEPRDPATVEPLAIVQKPAKQTA